MKLKGLLTLMTVLFIAGCSQTRMAPTEVDLVGWVTGSFVSTSEGLLKGQVLQVEDEKSKRSIALVSGNSHEKIAVVLLEHSDPGYLEKFSGRMVSVSGSLRMEHVEYFHTDTVLVVREILEAPENGQSE